MERLAGGAAAMETKAAKDFGETGEVGVHFARRETGLRPVGLAVAGVEQCDRAVAITMKSSLDQMHRRFAFTSLFLSIATRPRAVLAGPQKPEH